MAASTSSGVFTKMSYICRYYGVFRQGFLRQAITTHATRPLCSKPSDGNDSESPDKPAERKQVNLSKPGKKKMAIAAEYRQAKLEAQQKDAAEAMKLDPSLVSAAKDVAEALGGDTGQTKSELLQQLRTHVAVSEAQRQGDTQPQGSIKSMLSGMKVQSERRSGGPRRGQLQDRGGGEARERGLGHRDRGGDRRGDRGGWDPAQGGVMEALTGHRAQLGRARARGLNIKLFEGPALDIFTTDKDSSAVAPTPEKTLFDELEREAKEGLMTFPPTNAFEQMIRQTKEGKLWKFPIDNEQGLDEEAKVGFHEHVFLDHLLEGFPERGPVRHFMELVITGLSKNPYLTVQQKHEHVQWFKDYFIDKKHILDELVQVEVKSIEAAA